MQDLRDEYLDITEKAQIDNSVSGITYISREPESSRFNFGDNIRIVINFTSNWLLPSKAYLYVDCDTVIASLSSTVLPPLGITILGMVGALSAALSTKFNLKKRKGQL